MFSWYLPNQNTLPTQQDVNYSPNRMCTVAIEIFSSKNKYLSSCGCDFYGKAPEVPATTAVPAAAATTGTTVS